MSRPEMGPTTGDAGQEIRHGVATVGWQRMAVVSCWCILSPAAGVAQLGGVGVVCWYDGCWVCRGPGYGAWAAGPCVGVSLANTKGMLGW